jgi:hypothetical protein
VGGGFWAPNNEDLLRIRKEFEADTTAIEKIPLTLPSFSFSANCKAKMA